MINGEVAVWIRGNVNLVVVRALELMIQMYVERRQDRSILRDKGVYRGDTTWYTRIFYP